MQPYQPLQASKSPSFPGKMYEWKNLNYRVQTHTNGSQEMDSVGQKRAVGPEQAW